MSSAVSSQSQAQAQQQQNIALEDLSVEQLSQIKQQLDEVGESKIRVQRWQTTISDATDDCISTMKQEVQHLTQSFAALKQAQAKFTDAKTSLDEISPAKASKPLLVPLTSSLYVPGKLADPENVLVDVGARYYVEKSTKDAKTFYNTKILELRRNLDTLEPVIVKKNENRQVVVEFLQMKLSAREKEKKHGPPSKA